MQTYDVGDLAPLRATFTDPDDPDEALDPDDVTFIVREPDGTVTSESSTMGTDVENPDPGVYLLHWPCRVGGVHHYRVEADGGITAAEEAAFMVRPSRVLPLPEED